jgi:phosphoribosylformylglycinamidine cyclo-ligase
MGVGMSITVDKNDADKALEILRTNGEDAYIVGEVIKSDEACIIK